MNAITVNKVIKDIRYYERGASNTDGSGVPRELGNLFKPAKDTNYIGQRIARKLHELKCSFGAYTHIYITLNTGLKENQIEISNRNIGKAIKYIDIGVNQVKFNCLTEEQKNELIKSATIEILLRISDGNNLALVNETAKQLAQFDTEIKIHCKTKETSSYKISIYYQIEPIGSFTKAIVEYLDKKNNSGYKGAFQLEFYDDIYPLVGTVTLKNKMITLKPKESFRASLHNVRYTVPIELNIDNFEKYNF